MILNSIVCSRVCFICADKIIDVRIDEEYLILKKNHICLTQCYLFNLLKWLQVLDKKTVDEQIVEMRQWFKAFRDQDHSVRDYRKHFKPVLCYLEGGWTHSTKKIEEPFFRYSCSIT